jgi:hypothetical protein
MCWLTGTPFSHGNSYSHCRFNFAYHSDPNGDGLSTNLADWPAYGTDANIITLARDAYTVFKDDFRQEEMQYFFDRPEVFFY